MVRSILQMRFRTRVWSLGKLVFVLGGMGLTFLLSFGLSVRVALQAREVEVPLLQGRSLDDASRVLAALDLGLRSDDPPRPDDRVPAGRIIQQDPPAGSTARRQRSVRVWTSSGPRALTVPRVLRESERTATIRIQNEGLEVEAVSDFRSADYDVDAVVAQYPAPSARATQVALLVSRGAAPAAYVMPDIVGMDAGVATTWLQEHGLRVATAPTTGQADSQAGVVVRQQPPPGVRVTSADAITLDVTP